MSRERYKQTALVSTVCVRPCRVRTSLSSLCHPYGVSRYFFQFPTASAEGYVVSFLRDFRGIASSSKLLQAADEQVR